MEPESALQHLPMPTIIPYLELEQSSPSYYLKIHFNIIFSFTPVSLKWPLHQVSTPKPCMHLACPPYVPFVPPPHVSAIS